MGNDGGSIPGRKDLVKEKGRQKKLENNDLVESSKAKYCSLSKEPLKKPVVGCKLGFLYNKEALINAMLDKRLPKIYSHISSLKDVKDLNLKLSEQNGETKIICPISMIEYSGLNTFYFFWNCGCLISKKAFDELHMKDKCILCSKDFNKETDLVSLNYTKEERARLFQKIMVEKLNKKAKKEKSKNIQKEKIGNNCETTDRSLIANSHLNLQEDKVNVHKNLKDHKDHFDAAHIKNKALIEIENEEEDFTDKMIRRDLGHSNNYLMNKKRKRSEESD